MKPITTAITLMQLAREQLETELSHRGLAYTKADADMQDLQDVVEDIGTALCVLEGFS